VVLQEHGLAYLVKQRKFLQDEAYRRSKYASVPSKDWLAKAGKKDYEVSSFAREKCGECCLTCGNDSFLRWLLFLAAVVLQLQTGGTGGRSGRGRAEGAAAQPGLFAQGQTLGDRQGRNFPRPGGPAHPSHGDWYVDAR